MAERESSGYRVTPWWSDVARQALGTTLGALVAAPLLFLGAWLVGIVGDLNGFQIGGLLVAVGASVVGGAALVRANRMDKEVIEQWDVVERMMDVRDEARRDRTERGRK